MFAGKIIGKAIQQLRFNTMRSALFVLPILALSSPALPQPAPQLPPQFADPATADRLANAMQAMSKAFLDLPVGEVEAALEGRPATAADHHRTIRSETGMNDGQLRAQIAATRPMIRQSINAMNAALPGVMQGLAQAQQSLQRAIANMPDPNYPKR